jgi:hypothetical protein
MPLFLGCQLLSVILSEILVELLDMLDQFVLTDFIGFLQRMTFSTRDLLNGENTVLLSPI